MPNSEKVADTDTLQPGERLSLIVGDVPALLIRIDDAYYCIEDTCSHDGQAMTDGPIAGCEITCPRHGARFSIKTGKALCMPATEAVEAFNVEIRDDGIYVTLPD